MTTVLADPDPFSPAEIARVSRRVTLPDGRGLGIAEFGPQDGPPILYFHGWPSCRLEPAIFGVNGVRIIAVDRPGYGLSDAAEGRRLSDWPRDVKSLARSLGLDRFAVFGLSGGAPFAAAVAAAMPDRVAGLALVSGLGPPACQGMRQGRVKLLLGAGRHALSGRIILTAARRTLLAEANGERLLNIRQRYVNRSQSDAAAFTEECGRRMLACWREGLRRGVEGAASDARIYGEPWPFELGQIRVPTDIWHGEDDRIVAASVGRAYAAALPGARCFFLPQEGHVSLIAKYQDEIVDRLLARF